MKLNIFDYDLVKYIIPCYKLKKNIDKEVILISDLHGITKNRKKSCLLSNAIKLQNPNHIIIAGDIFQGYEWENENVIKDFSYFLSDLSENIPIFLILGNHDLWGNNESNSSLRINNFKKLENVRNGMIYPLINDIVYYDDFEIITYTPALRLINNNSIQKEGYANNMFVEEYSKNGFMLNNSENIKEFIVHNPHLILSNNNILSILHKIDIFYSGHLHNGYIPFSLIKKYPDKYLDNGFVELPYECDNNGKIMLRSFNPIYFGKINLCRGVVYFNNEGKEEYLELRNNHFYINKSCNNSTKWYPIYSNDAINDIINRKLKTLVISGGIKKYSYFSDLIDKPEITKVLYKGMK